MLLAWVGNTNTNAFPSMNTITDKVNIIAQLHAQYLIFVGLSFIFSFKNE